VQTAPLLLLLVVLIVVFGELHQVSSRTDSAVICGHLVEFEAWHVTQSPTATANRFPLLLLLLRVLPHRLISLISSSSPTSVLEADQRHIFNNARLTLDAGLLCTTTGHGTVHTSSQSTTGCVNGGRRFVLRIAAADTAAPLANSKGTVLHYTHCPRFPAHCNMLLLLLLLLLVLHPSAVAICSAGAVCGHLSTAPLCLRAMSCYPTEASKTARRAGLSAARQGPWGIGRTYGQGGDSVYGADQEGACRAV
jgi:hypothetical protein